jgi:nucleoside-diphosphate-sugar epimerase
MPTPLSGSKAGWTGRAVLSGSRSKKNGNMVKLSMAILSTLDDVHNATGNMDAIVHLAVYASRDPDACVVNDQKPFSINLKGLWNVLESARQRQIPRIVHNRFLPSSSSQWCVFFF